MIVCPFCDFARNPNDAYVCAQCGKALPDTRSTLFRRPTRLLNPDVISHEISQAHTEVLILSQNELAIHINGEEAPMVLRVTGDLLLGRFAGVEAETPAMLDFAPYNGFHMGVSRRHAMLRRLGNDLGIVDLESTNGTWINGVQIKPHESVLLRSGDRIALGRLLFRITLPREAIPVPGSPTLRADDKPAY